MKFPYNELTGLQWNFVNIPQNMAPNENYMVLEIERHHFN